MDKLRIGILGLGRGITHLKNFLSLPEAEVIGACDRFPLLRERAQEHIAAAGASTPVLNEFDELLALRPDAIMVATNGKLQVEHACQALNAGCHVLSEVPGAYTQQECMRLRETVEYTGKTYMLAENTCYWDFFRYFRKWVAADRFGPISIAEGEYIHHLPATLMRPDGSRLSPTAARAAGHRDATPIWRADQPPIQYLTHDLGPLLEVLDDRCISVSCRSAPCHSPDAPMRSDGQIALFETAKGTLIKIMVTLNTRRPSEHRYRIFGIEGGTEWFSYEKAARRFSREADHKDGWDVIPIGLGAHGDDTSAGHGGADLKTARHFTRAILAGTPAPIDVYRAIEYTLPGILANKSADLGGAPVPIPDIRRTPFTHTHFWDSLGLPDVDPDPIQYQALA
ncbi:MAG: Gfo/Idh/MocA family oxidoreductase [Gemmatimonadetes bacterium]|nr:Gfo/Idh/MocA family oxidoreductase [Gemmatimonadota bacterium]